MTIPLFRHTADAAEIEAVTRVLRSGWLGKGSMVAELERRFAAYTGYRHCVTTSSCTAALELCCREGLTRVDTTRITCPTWTFCADAHSIVNAGGVPVFYDWLGSYRTKGTGLSIVVHFAGAPAPLPKGPYGLVIEDCAHSIGATFTAGSKNGGSWCSCYSFHAVKAIGCGDGGAICTDDGEWAERARRLTWHGIDRGTYERTAKQAYTPAYDIPEIGYKAHWNDLAAAVGLAQLDKLDDSIAQKRAIADVYDTLLDYPSLISRNWSSAHHLYVCRVNGDRDAARAALAAKGITTGVHYKPLHQFACYGPWTPGGGWQCPQADALYPHVLSLPLWPGMTTEQAEEVVEALKPFGPEVLT